MGNPHPKPAPKGNKYAVGNKGGRPSHYDPKYCSIAKKMSELGATQAEMADAFGVQLSTLRAWIVTYKEFAEATKCGREVMDERVKQSLYHRAMGYEHDEVDIKVVDGKIVQTYIRKHYPPDTGALQFWLRNRKSSEWSDKVEINQKTELSGTVDVNVNPTEAYLKMIGK